MRPESTTTLSPSALPTDFAAAAREFLDYIQGECGLADNTAAAYRRDLSQFGSHLTDAGVGSLADITPSGIEGFLRAQSAAGKAASSIARALAAVRMFCRFCVLQRKLREDPSAAIDPPHQWERLPHTLSDPAARMLLEVPCGGEDRHWRRDRAILTLLYAAGLRASELAGAAIGDVNFDLGIIRVLGKGRKERVVPVAEAALEAVRDYLCAKPGKQTDPSPSKGEGDPEERVDHGTQVTPFSRCRDGSGRLDGKQGVYEDEHGHPKGTGATPAWPCHPEEPLFASRTGRAMRREDVFRLVRKYVRRAALRGHVSPHTFRHAFATQLLAGGADLRSVQEMLGHADIATTQIYTHVDVSRLKAIHRKFHPRG